jgi:hypothetical protein
MEYLHTPESMRLIVPMVRLRRATRRGVLLGAAGATLALHRASAQKFKPRDRATEEAEIPADAFTGDLYGHTVAWDPEFWRFSVASEAGDTTDWVTLNALETFSGFHVEHGEVPFSTIAEAEDGALGHYLGIYGRTVDDIVHIESWSSRDAVGELYYWTGYDDNPYTYIEYAPTDDEGIWSIMYYQIRASSYDGSAMAEELDTVFLDDESPVRAAEVDEISAAIEDDL